MRAGRMVGTNAVETQAAGVSRGTVVVIGNGRVAPRRSTLHQFYAD
jgi:DNA-binding XRE family transcriptional regulator